MCGKRGPLSMGFSMYTKKVYSLRTIVHIMQKYRTIVRILVAILNLRETIPFLGHGKVRSWRWGWACGIRISVASEQAGRQRSRQG